ncbi:histidine-containing phosphotransfer protein 1 isoform X2 [Arabidopsis lyrata subsp. lyrata]|uniref:histidine-containing phosphotransfer protein 1 isoform X2 n=1 Tax=Arabidopsis lyrata subsp. lyrata TaxID=81972 RepID=UPI000A29D284|nr:histidine-containing phosphotransfer protein 1 isoform X2 [Arabidopsis lyrata subsp. lyrata]|eukprot:XP_020885928.1 histidine-containing phosphotransfer protein 1 isoform X2 [Arabidopsis lyrata subsp. lyrata]
MDLVQMQKSLQDYTKSLFLEGILDSQFLQLQQLQDESNPDFVSQVVTLFFQDSDRILNDLSLSLDQQVVDFKKVDPHVHQLKGSSSRCHRCLQQVKQEYYLVKNRLETLFKLEQQIVASGGMIPAVELGF